MLDQLKIKNLTNILVCLFSQQTATKAELVQLTGLSNSTVSSSVNSLLKLDLLACVGMEDSGGGRRSTIYRLNKSYGQFIGADMQDTELKIVVTDCENQLIDRQTYPIDSARPAIDQLTTAIEQMVAQYPKVLGIGIGLDAQIDHENQVVRHCDTFGWHHVHLKEILERHFMFFTYLDHRANGAAIREGLVGQAKGLKNYLCYYESAKRKAAVVLDGQICRGHRNCTGRVEDMARFIASAQGFADFLDLSRVFIGYNTEDHKKYLMELAPALSDRIVCFPEADDTVAVGMATVAQKEWFQSIYFML